MDGQPPEELAISTLSFGELWAGVISLGYGRRRAFLTQWLWTVIPDRFSGRIVPVTTMIALEWGRLTAEAKRKGRPIPVADALLVATALTPRAHHRHAQRAALRRVGRTYHQPVVRQG